MNRLFVRPGARAVWSDRGQAAWTGGGDGGVGKAGRVLTFMHCFTIRTLYPFKVPDRGVCLMRNAPRTTLPPIRCRRPPRPAPSLPRTGNFAAMPNLATIVPDGVSSVLTSRQVSFHGNAKSSLSSARLHVAAAQLTRCRCVRGCSVRAGGSVCACVQRVCGMQCMCGDAVCVRGRGRGQHRSERRPRRK